MNETLTELAPQHFMGYATIFGHSLADCSCGWRSGSQDTDEAMSRLVREHFLEQHIGECLACGHVRPLAVWRDSCPGVGVCTPCRNAAESVRGPHSDPNQPGETCWCWNVPDQLGQSLDSLQRKADG